MAARLPMPGDDTGSWGDLLNEFLQVEHAADGTHRAVVGNMASLRVTAGATGGKVRLQGYYVAGDGGEGGFRWDDASILADDGGTIIQVTGVGTGRWLRSVEGEISALAFGVRRDGTETYNEIESLHAYAVTHARNCYFPKGVYNLGAYSYPAKNYTLVPSSLLSQNGITIRGDGRQTVFKTVSATGADVFNLAAVSDITLRDFSITATLTEYLGSGTNAISIVHGGRNIRLSNLWIEDLPFVDKVTYLDGGKAVTLQGSSTVLGLEYSNIRVDNVYVRNCVYGLNIDNDFDNAMSSAYDIAVDGFTAEDCYEGISMGLTAPGAALLEADVKPLVVAIDNFRTVNCQKDVLVARWVGLRLVLQTIKTRSSYPTFLPGDTYVAGCIFKMLRGSSIKYNGYVSNAQCKLDIGGAYASTNISGESRNNVIVANVDGSTTDDIVVSDAGGAEVTQSVFVLTHVTVNPRIYELKNLVISDNGHFIDTVRTDRLQFLWSDNRQALNEMYRDGTAIVVKQTASSGASATVFGLKDHAGNDIVKFGNDGRLHLIPTTSAAIGSYVSKLAIYDMTGALIGYVPIYA